MKLNKNLLGHVFADKDLIINGYLYGKVYIQKESGAKSKSYKIYNNKKGYYFKLNGKNIYLPLLKSIF